MWKMRQTVFMLRYLNDIWFIRLGGVVLIFKNTGGKLRDSMFTNIYVEIGMKAANCKKKKNLVQLKEASCVTEHGQQMFGFLVTYFSKFLVGPCNKCVLRVSRYANSKRDNNVPMTLHCFAFVQRLLQKKTNKY